MADTPASVDHRPLPASFGASQLPRPLLPSGPNLNPLLSARMTMLQQAMTSSAQSTAVFGGPLPAANHRFGGTNPLIQDQPTFESAAQNLMSSVLPNIPSYIYQSQLYQGLLAMYEARKRGALGMNTGLQNGSGSLIAGQDPFQGISSLLHQQHQDLMSKIGSQNSPSGNKYSRSLTGFPDSRDGHGTNLGRGRDGTGIGTGAMGSNGATQGQRSLKGTHVAPTIHPWMSDLKRPFRSQHGAGSVGSSTHSDSKDSSKSAPMSGSKKGGRMGSEVGGGAGSKRTKYVRRLQFDDETTSPVSGMFIKELGHEKSPLSQKSQPVKSKPSSNLTSPGRGKDEKKEPLSAAPNTTGDIVASLNLVEVSDEARAEIDKIPNIIGAYICQLCKVEFDDAFLLAAHSCPRIGHVEYRCPECSKVFNCPANLASHQRWHKPWKNNSQNVGQTDSTPSNQSNNHSPNHDLSRSGGDFNLPPFSGVPLDDSKFSISDQNGITRQQKWNRHGSFNSETVSSRDIIENFGFSGARSIHNPPNLSPTQSHMSDSNVARLQRSMSYKDFETRAGPGKNFPEFFTNSAEGNVSGLDLICGRNETSQNWNHEEPLRKMIKKSTSFKDLCGQDRSIEYSKKFQQISDEEPSSERNVDNEQCTNPLDLSTIRAGIFQSDASKSPSPRSILTSHSSISMDSSDHPPSEPNPNSEHGVQNPDPDRSGTSILEQNPENFGSLHNFQKSHQHFHGDPQLPDNLQCQICGKKYLNHAYLRRHSIAVHSPFANDSYGEGEVKCNLCDFWFPDTGALDAHTIAHNQ